MASKGVYSILCVPTATLYFGSSMRSIENRFSWHRAMLKSGRHNTPGLMADYLEHGPEAFVYQYEFLTDDPAEAKEEEQNLIAKYESYNHFHNPTADFSEKNRRISAAHAETRATPEWKEMQSELTAEQHRQGKFGRQTWRIYNGT